MAPVLHVSPETLDVLLRLAAATLVGTVLGLNRELKRKPTGARTLALVCLGAALVAVSAVHYPGMGGSADAMSRVLQGVVQGVMTGVGFIGAGVIIRGHRPAGVRNLTTAATVWVTAALGVACALAAWEVVLIGAALALLVLLFGAGLERWAARLFGGAKAKVGDERLPAARDAHAACDCGRPGSTSSSSTAASVPDPRGY